MALFAWRGHAVDTPFCQAVRVFELERNEVVGLFSGT